ncbi:unnamed protein product [Meganyctiphanes norvegica]|uniref:RNA 3'-terminal phosphate cyclase n=1 Tax=Meganyctiphanes norvegica TaxID=48144 RepID=A0AAV2SPD1_MEGNR
MSREIIEIDGSYLEGGGQILRMSLALSAIQGKSVKVINIRAGRPKPGLMPQHLSGLLLGRDICNGKLDGGVQGSTEMTLIPGKITGGEHLADTKTAGSVMLLVQAVYLCTLYGNESSHVVMRGGTDADFAPPVDYTIEIFRKISSKFGANFDILLNRRGFYPRGSGEVIFKASPVKSKLNAVEMVDVGKVKAIRGRAYVAGKLPIHVAQKMVDEAKRILMECFGDAQFDIKSIKEDQQKAFGNGSGIVLWAETSTGCILGGSSVGKPNKDAYTNGRDAAEIIIKAFNAGACLDHYAQDQVVILMALAEGKSRFRVGEITNHTKTAIFVAEKLTKAKFCINDHEKGSSIIECDGVGWDPLNRSG